MPSKPPHPCGQSGCATLVQQGAYCPEHQRARVHDPQQRKFYSSSRWTVLSKLIRQRDPICKVCGRAPSTSADHKDGDITNNLPENLQGLCRDCHDEKSGKEHRRKQG